MTIMQTAVIFMMLCLFSVPAGVATASEEEPSGSEAVQADAELHPQLGYVLGLKGASQLLERSYSYQPEWLARGVRDAAEGKTMVDRNAMREAISLWRSTAAIPDEEDKAEALAKQEMEGQTARVSYTLGVALWNQLNGLVPRLNPDDVVDALYDSIEGQEMRVGFVEAKAIYDDWQKQREEKKLRLEMERNKVRDAQVLAENAQKPDVQVTEEGLQYKVLREGKGPTPAVSDQVSVRYSGWLLDGRQFDTSESKGGVVDLELARVIPAWQIALTRMNPGSKWRIWAPAELAYGDKVVDARIPPGSAMMFDIELVRFVDRSNMVDQFRKRLEAEMQKGVEFVTEYSKKPDVKALGKGALYRVLQEGDGPSPTLEDVVRVHYKGRVVGGEQFEDTYAKDKPVIFPLEEVLAGWRLALPEMQVGSKWELVVPPALGLGVNSQEGIPPGATMVFELELLEILDEIQRQNFKALRQGTTATQVE